eukprot:1550172-Ditylum_brightwellii.AAC.1
MAWRIYWDLETENITCYCHGNYKHSLANYNNLKNSLTKANHPNNITFAQLQNPSVVPGIGTKEEKQDNHIPAAGR